MRLIAFGGDERMRGALAADLRARGIEAFAFADTDAILAHLKTTCRPGDVVAILSNGGFDAIHDRLLTLLGQAA